MNGETELPTTPTQQANEPVTCGHCGQSVASCPDGKAIVQRMESFLSRYVSLQKGLELPLSLWCLGTYLFDCFDAFPYLAITSPTKRCGKTRLSELLQFICYQPTSTVGISPAALFRTIEQKKPTLFIDEAEGLSGKGERVDALKEVLNAGYRKGQRVIRCGTKDKSFEPKEYETFCPKAIVLIGVLSDTLNDRCILVQMQRSTRPVNRFRRSRVGDEIAGLADATRQWCQGKRADILNWYTQNDLTFLTDREAELWLPLFSVCAVVAPERFDELQQTAIRMASDKNAAEPADQGIKLLMDIQGLFSRNGHDRFPTQELLRELNSIAESPWPGWYRGRGLDARWLSRMLSPYGIQPKTIRQGNVTPKGYDKDDFEDAWKRYLFVADE